MRPNLVLPFLVLLFPISNSQNYTVGMMSNFFPHATDWNLLQLVEGMNNVSTAAARKAKIQQWVATRAGSVVNPTYTFYDNRTYGVQKALGFVDQREAMKNFLKNYVKPNLTRDGYLTNEVADKVLSFFWVRDAEFSGSRPYEALYLNFGIFASQLIPDFSKKELLYRKMLDMQRATKGKDPASNITFGYEVYDRAFMMDVLAKYNF